MTAQQALVSPSYKKKSLCRNGSHRNETVFGRNKTILDFELLSDQYADFQYQIMTSLKTGKVQPGKA